MFWKTLDRVVDFLAAICLISTASIVALQVFYRYVLNRPLLWPLEVSLFLFVYLVWFGGAAGMRDNREIRIELAECKAVVNNKPAVSRRSLGADGSIRTGTFEFSAGVACQLSAGIFRVAQYQSPITTAWSCTAAGPVILTCVSRHGLNFGSRPRYSSPTLCPPTQAVFPSTTTILRWLRKLSWKRFP